MMEDDDCSVLHLVKSTQWSEAHLARARVHALAYRNNTRAALDAGIERLSRRSAEGPELRPISTLDFEASGTNHCFPCMARGLEHDYDVMGKQ